MSGVPPIPQRSDSLQSAGDGGAAVSSANREAVDDSEVQADLSSSQSDLALVEFEEPDFYRETLKRLQTFADGDQLCDVEIRCGSKSMKCHRVILASVSGYFRAMFMGEMLESRQSVINIQDIDENVMENIIRYAYNGKITIHIENVQSILYAASILQIESVSNACSDFMKDHLHPDNCVEVLAFAKLHNQEQLIKYTEDFFVENFVDVSQRPNFVTVSPDIMETLVSSDYLNVDNEIEVYEAVMRWIEDDRENKKNYLPSLISKIKLPLIETHYLMEKVAVNEMIRSSHDCRDLLEEAHYYHMYLGNLTTELRITERTRPRKSYAGVLFCVGGRGASGDPYKTIECYHPMKGRWFQVTEMNTRRRHVGVCSYNGQIYAVGGHNGNKHLGSGEVFDPSTGKWRKIANMVTQKTGVRGLGLACMGGAIYAVGGLDDKNCFDTVERYDPVANTWTQVASLNLPRGGVGVAVLKGQLYAIGGNDGTSSLSRCESYDPFVNKWTPIADMGCRRAGAGVGVLDGFIYAVGGFDDNYSLDTCERYSPKTQKWESVFRLSCPRGGVGLAALGGRLYAVGGHDGKNYLNSVEAYDPLTDRWEQEASVEISRAGAGVVLLPGRIGVIPDSLEINYFTTGTGNGGPELCRTHDPAMQTEGQDHTSSWEAIEAETLHNMAGAGLVSCQISVKVFKKLCIPDTKTLKEACPVPM